MPLPIAETIVSEKIITGSLMGSTLIQIDIPRLIALYEDNRLMLDELISARYPLSQINEAMAEMESGEVLRNVITFE